jgi:hypothetical protein
MAIDQQTSQKPFLLFVYRSIYSRRFSMKRISQTLILSAGLLALLLSLIALPGEAAPTAVPIDVWDIHDLAMAESDANGVNYGFMLKEVNGPVIFGYNASNGLFGQFYPASTVKIFHHLHAMRWAEAQPGTLANALMTPIPVYKDSCSAVPDDIEIYKPLVSVLMDMMQNSDNKMTNAIQLYFGQEAINATIHDVVGMSGWTNLNHRLGCGGPSNDPANEMTLTDVLLLYERYAAGDLIGESVQGPFEVYMLNQDNTQFLDNRINNNLASAGLSEAQKTEFRNMVSLALKMAVMTGILTMMGKATVSIVQLLDSYACHIKHAVVSPCAPLSTARF